MQMSPNQKMVITQKTLSDENHVYSKTNVEASLTAAKTLSDRAYKLYSRMNLHIDAFAYALSPATIKKEIGMSESKYRAAVKELIENGYLVLVKGRKKLFTFYEYPQKDCMGNAACEPIEGTADPVWGEENSVTDELDLEEHTLDEAGYTADTKAHSVNMAISSIEMDRMTTPIPSGNLTNSYGEISQDITTDTEINIPIDNEEDILSEMTPEEYHEALSMTFAEMEKERKVSTSPYNYYSTYSLSDRFAPSSHSINGEGDDDWMLPF